MTNKSRMLYVGVTNDLERRVFEHKRKLLPGFTKRYGLSKLVYFESTNEVTAAIEREKEIKGWVRRKKTVLIHSLNPEWKDLSEDWFEQSVILSEAKNLGGGRNTPTSDILHYVQDDNEYAHRATKEVQDDKKYTQV
jgi:putative endonuclease